MKKQLVIIGIVALLVSGGLSGCSSNPNNNSTSPNNSNNTPPTNLVKTEQNRIIGTWTRPYSASGSQEITLTVTFFSNGTMTASTGIDFNNGQSWELKDGMLTISLAGTVIIAWNYVFSDHDVTLTLTKVNETQSIIYTRQ